MLKLSKICQTFHALCQKRHWWPKMLKSVIKPKNKNNYFSEEIVITWTHIRWVRWMFQNLPLPAAQEVHDSSSVTPCIVMKNDGVLYHQVSSFPPESMHLRSFHQSERTTARTRYNTRDELILAIGQSILNINKDWCSDGVSTFPNIWQKVINKGATIFNVHKCCAPVNKAMSEISNCCHYFFIQPLYDYSSVKFHRISPPLWDRQ